MAQSAHVLGSRSLSGMIFDLDGTLTDTVPISFAAFRTAVAQFTDRRFTDAELVCFFGPSEDGILRQLLPQHWQRCFECYLEEYAARHAGRTVLFPGIETALDLLAESDMRLAIVTGKAQRATVFTLEHTNILRFFDAIEAGSAEGGIKPRSIRKVLARWGLQESRVAYLGDTIYDMQAASAVGVTGIGAAWGGTGGVDELKAAGAALTFATVEGFVGWLRP
jgi:phosphoglycolate phosphatase-like HAD superfamily hydrolase